MRATAIRTVSLLSDIEFVPNSGSVLRALAVGSPDVLKSIWTTEFLRIQLRL